MRAQTRPLGDANQYEIIGRQQAHRCVLGMDRQQLQIGHESRDGNFVPGARSTLHRKDARIISGLARRLGVVTPAFDVVAEALESLVEAGGADLDHSALVTLIEAESGVRLTDAAAED